MEASCGTRNRVPTKVVWGGQWEVLVWRTRQHLFFFFFLKDSDFSEHKNWIDPVVTPGRLSLLANGEKTGWRDLDFSWYKIIFLRSPTSIKGPMV